jgi:Xaa-Pro dipeptidase
VFDPLNIHFATDSTNMQLWNTHNPFRSLIFFADGYMVVCDHKNSPFLSQFNPRVNEQRSGADFFYFDRGDMAHLATEKFSQEVLDLVREHGRDNMQLAVHKVMLVGLPAPESLEFEVMEGDELTVKVFVIKGTDEIKAMRCASHACETAVRAMEDAARSGVPSGQMSEDDIWAVLHAENIQRCGEWIETRLLAFRPRTSPWFRECGPRLVQNN